MTEPAVPLSKPLSFRYLAFTSSRTALSMPSSAAVITSADCPACASVFANLALHLQLSDL